MINKAKNIIKKIKSAPAGKKFLIILYSLIFLAILTAIIIMGYLQWQKNAEEKAIEQVRTQINNYYDYQFQSIEYTKIKKGPDDMVYYYAADGKRYVFPTQEIYQSWFPNIKIADVNSQSLEKLYETPLGGNVFFRPGSLLTTPSIFDTYLVIKNGQIRKINENLLKQIYGENYQNLVNSLPEYYFSQYKIIEPIKILTDFPEIPLEITIDQNKGLK